MTNKIGITRSIISQLGGSGCLNSMIGAKDFLSIDGGLSFKFTAKAKNQSNYIKIVLNGKDLYNVTFGYVHGSNYTVRSEHSDIYAEDLIILIERETELFLTMD